MKLMTYVVARFIVGHFPSVYAYMIKSNITPKKCHCPLLLCIYFLAVPCIGLNWNSFENLP